MKKLGFIFIIISVFLACKSSPEPEQEEVPPPSSPSELPPPSQELIPFSVSMREELKPDQLGKVQFYLSGSITLTKQENQENIDVESGKIIALNGQNLQEVYIPSQTEGVYMSDDEHGILNISFEAGNDAVICFAPNKNKDRYVLMLKDRDGQLVVNYGSIDYEVSLSGAEIPYLLVGTEQIKRDAIDSKTLTGRKVE
ncbi:MAG: hypothetical protein LBT95_07770 [Treponema sp.]|jgi:hypothetical protein|nr:hypothetical protein [Treponema sp.]